MKMSKFRYTPPSMLTIKCHARVGTSVLDIEFKAYPNDYDAFDEIIYASGMNKGKRVGYAIARDNRDEMSEAAHRAFREHHEAAKESFEGRY